MAWRSRFRTAFCRFACGQPVSLSRMLHSRPGLCCLTRSSYIPRPGCVLRLAFGQPASLPRCLAASSAPPMLGSRRPARSHSAVGRACKSQLVAPGARSSPSHRQIPQPPAPSTRGWGAPVGLRPGRARGWRGGSRSGSSPPAGPARSPARTP